MRKTSLQIILIAILIVIIGIPFINSAKSAGPYEDCRQLCKDTYEIPTVALSNCLEECEQLIPSDSGQETQTPTSNGVFTGLVPCGDDCTPCDLLILIQNVLDFALTMAFIMVIGFIVYGGFRWIFSLGKEENLKAGQQIITNAIIGLIIVLSAWIIINTVFWVIKQMGGDDYTGNWAHIECSG